MRQQWPGWQPEIITNKWVFRLLPIIFGGGNLIVIIWGAKPRTPGTTPRYWWPIIFFFIMAASFIYWGIMMITQVETTIENKKGEKRTIGNLIGFEVRIYNETDDGVPQAMQEAMVQSRLDGSRRRVGYKASLFHTDLGNLVNSLTKNSSPAYSRRSGSGVETQKMFLEIFCFRVSKSHQGIPARKKKV
jgi:hypothetical protein